MKTPQQIRNEVEKKKKTKKKFDFMILLVIIVIVIVSISAFQTIIKTKHNNWWTNTYCIEQKGIYEEHFFYNTCMLNNMEYRAKFIYVSSNTMPYSEHKEWRLVPI